MLKASIENIKDYILENNTYFNNGFCNVYQNEEVGVVLSGNVPVFPADFGNYFYLRLPNNVSFNDGTYYGIADSLKGVGLVAQIVLVAVYKDGNSDLLLTNLVNTIQSKCGENIELTSASYIAEEVIKQELAFMPEESRIKALQNLPKDLSIVSLSFTYSIPFTYTRCIEAPCPTC